MILEKYLLYFIITLFSPEDLAFTFVIFFLKYQKKVQHIGVVVARII